AEQTGDLQGESALHVTWLDVFLEASVGVLETARRSDGTRDANISRRRNAELASTAGFAIRSKVNRAGAGGRQHQICRGGHDVLVAYDVRGGRDRADHIDVAVAGDAKACAARDS